MFRILAGALLLAVASVTVTAATYSDKATKLRFPDKLGPWEKRNVRHYDNPAHVTSISYRHPLTDVATFYIYHNGLKKIPSRGKGDVMEEFASVIQQVETTYSGAEYEHLKTGHGCRARSPALTQNCRTWVKSIMCSAFIRDCMRTTSPRQASGSLCARTSLKG